MHEQMSDSSHPSIIAVRSLRPSPALALLPSIVVPYSSSGRFAMALDLRRFPTTLKPCQSTRLVETAHGALIGPSAIYSCHLHQRSF